jgi:predicted acylesterase/phospholipase RssA/CRP-like cAMP-binding protein
MQSSAASTPDIVSAVRGAPLLAGVAPDTLDALVRAAAAVSLGDGDDALADDASLCVIAQGSVDVVEEDGPALRWMRAGDVFDRQQALAGVSRRALVRAAGAAALARIPAATVEALETADAAFRAAVARMHARQLLCRLAPVLGVVDCDLMDELERAAGWTYLNRGDVLFDQGDPADGLFFVVSGRLLVERVEPDGSARPIGEAGRGESIGEMAFFTGGVRSARVSAVRDSVLVHFTNAEFDALVAAHPQVMRHVAQGLVARLNRANANQSLSQVTNVAVMAASPGAPVAAFCRRISDALAAFGPVLRLSAESVDALMGEPGIAQAPEDTPECARLLAWIEAREAASRFLVFEADAGATAWTRRCLDQADRVVLLARADEDPEPGPAERALLQHHCRVTDAKQWLVLVHPEGTAHLPRGTRRWLEPRTEEMHFHLRWGEDGDVGRLARWLAGKAVALVLGGGGARGLAHIGMVRALREAGVPIDLVGGTSFGASVAAQVAMGWSPERLEHVNRRVWVKIRPHKVYTLPVISIIGTRKSDAVGRMMYGDTEIEDLWTPFFCVSSDMATAEMNVHRSGSLLWAATASASLPGAAQPVLHGGHLNCDGALLNNLPVDVARRLGAGIVIAAEVSNETDERFACDRIPRPTEILRDRIFRRHRIRFPSLMELALRASMLHSASTERQAIETADFALRPPVDRFSLMDFSVMDALVQLGHEYARAEVASWIGRGAFRGIVPAASPSPAPAAAGTA